MSAYPIISLAIDTCFASKRWSDPVEWLDFLQDVGLSSIEISADCDCDPLYVTEGYLWEWTERVSEQVRRRNMRVVSLYSGHGTYSMSGLAHPDARVRRNLYEHWLYPYAKAAGKMHAGIGFFMHAFADSILQDRETYLAAKDSLLCELKAAKTEMKKYGCAFFAVEQMYSPQQIPWTLHGVREFMDRSGMYTTIDTGHQIGQRCFLRPDRKTIQAAAESGEWLYVGTRKAQNLLASGKCTDAVLAELNADMDAHDYLFSDTTDGDLYTWLEHFAAYSPIIHLQQTDGSASAHKPFTTENNKTGIVTAEKVLKAIRCSYDRCQDLSLSLPRCREIHLTLELFFSLTETVDQIFHQVSESVRYWRDGIAAFSEAQ